MTATEAISSHIRVSRAALELKRDSGFVYRALQRGTLKGLCLDGHWFVDRESLEQLKAARPAVAA